MQPVTFIMTQTQHSLRTQTAAPIYTLPILRFYCAFIVIINQNFINFVADNNNQHCLHMNPKIMLLSAAVAVGTLSPAYAADPRISFENDDPAPDYVVRVAEVQHIAFAPDGIDLTASEVVHFPYSTLRKVTVDHEGVLTPTVSVTEITSESVMRVTPSPAIDTIRITGLDADQPLEIFSTGGTLVWSVARYSGARIDISELPTGLYIVKSNHQSAKFFKS